MSSNLTRQELLKYDWRIDRLIEKIRSGIPFETLDGNSVVIDEVEAGLVWSKINNRTGAINLRLKSYSRSYGWSIPSGKLKKTSDFGGEAKERRLLKEISAIKTLNEQILLARGDQPHIPVMVGDKVYNVAYAVKTPTPDSKSDMELLDENDISKVFISHKDGTKTHPKFHQWGGVSDFKRHDAVLDFISKFRAKYPDSVNGMTVGMPFNPSSDLSMMSIYGHDYNSGTMSRENVHMVLQGSPILSKVGDVYEINGIFKLLNGETPTGPYRPMICAKKCTRSDLGIKNTRVTIWPIGGRKFEPL